MHNISFVIFVYIPFIFPYYYFNYNKRLKEIKIDWSDERFVSNGYNRASFMYWLRKKSTSNEVDLRL